MLVQRAGVLRGTPDTSSYFDYRSEHAVSTGCNIPAKLMSLCSVIFLMQVSDTEADKTSEPVGVLAVMSEDRLSLQPSLKETLKGSTLPHSLKHFAVYWATKKNALLT